MPLNYSQDYYIALTFGGGVAIQPSGPMTLTLLVTVVVPDSCSVSREASTIVWLVLPGILVASGRWR